MVPAVVYAVVCCGHNMGGCSGQGRPQATPCDRQRKSARPGMRLAARRVAIRPRESRSVESASRDAAGHVANHRGLIAGVRGVGSFTSLHIT